MKLKISKPGGVDIPGFGHQPDGTTVDLPDNLARNLHSANSSVYMLAEGDDDPFEKPKRKRSTKAADANQPTREGGK
jgi:hypothetical protein